MLFTGVSLDAADTRDDIYIYTLLGCRYDAMHRSGSLPVSTDDSTPHMECYTILARAMLQDTQEGHWFLVCKAHTGHDDVFYPRTDSY